MSECEQGRFNALARDGRSAPLQIEPVEIKAEPIETQNIPHTRRKK